MQIQEYLRRVGEQNGHEATRVIQDQLSVGLAALTAMRRTEPLFKNTRAFSMSLIPSFVSL